MVSVKNNMQIHYQENISHINDILAKAATTISEWRMNDDDINDTMLIIEEIAANIVYHGFQKNDITISSREIKFKIKKMDDQIKIIFCDRSPRFNPILHQSAQIKNYLQLNMIGGLGIHFVKTLTKKIQYRYINSHNFLVLTKSLQ